MNKALTLAAVIGTASLTTSTLLAGDFSTPLAPVTPSAPASSKLTGTASLDLNSHFMSYGADVWGSGSSATRAFTFNPSLSIDYALTDKLTLSSGFWLDTNDNHGGGFKVQETDIWIGAAYNQGIATYSLTFQNWQYGGQSEKVLDFGVSLDTFLSPSLTIHHRLGEGASGGFDGTFLVLGAEYSYDVSDKLSLTIPYAVGFALSDFHTTETGYAYASLGLQASYALCDSTSFNTGITFYDTVEDVTGTSADNFLTYNAGISFSF